MKLHPRPVLLSLVSAGLLILLSVLVIAKVTVTSNEKPPTLFTEEAESVELAAKLGQSLIIGIPGPTLDPATQNILERLKPAGIVLYQWNYSSDEQLKKLINDLQAVSLKTSGLPLFIMTDAEPDGAIRFGLFQNAFRNGVPDWKVIGKDAARLKQLGINVDLAPPTDFPFRPDAPASRWQLQRFHNPSELMLFNRQFIKVLNEHGVLTVLKHFPGGGLLAGDPHDSLPQGQTEPEKLAASLDLFRDGLKSGASLVMTYHGRYDELDAEHIATLSPTIIQQLLQNQLGFKGLTLTDDLSEMVAVAKAGQVKRLRGVYERYGGKHEGVYNEAAGLARVGTEALLAGHQLIMFSHWLNNTAESFELMLQTAGRNAELEQRLNDNYKLIKEFKQQRLKLLVPNI